MADYITLKSKALEIYDYRQADISQFLTGFTPDEKQLEKDMNRWLRRYGKTVSAEKLENGDNATISCRSEVPRYNKPSVNVPVGKGLFDRELEKQMLGMTPGESRPLYTGDTTVEVTLLSASRTVLPEKTDEAIAALGVEGVASLQELRILCLQRQIEGFLLEDENPDMAAAFIWQKVAKNSRFERDEEECRQMDVQAEKRLKAVRESYPREIQAAAEAGEEVSDASTEEFTIDTFRQMYFTELDLAAVGQALLREENALLTKEDYEVRLQKLSDAHPDRSREQLMEQESAFLFAADYYADVLAQRIDAYVAQCYRDAFAK